MKNWMIFVLALIAFIVGGFFVTSHFMPAYVILSLLGSGFVTFVHHKWKEIRSFSTKK